MASYFTGEIVGVKRKAPEVITMVNGYPHVTYPAFDIVGKILGKNLAKDKFEVKVNNSNCILQVSDCDIFKIDYAGESEIFDSILLNDTLSQPYIYLGEFADHVLNKKRKAFGFGGFTQLSKKELKYVEADVKATKEAYAMFNKTPKYSVNDIVIINNGISDAYHVVGVIKDVYNHRDTGDVFYHIIFTSNGPRKIFEREIETKFNTGRFWRGHEICKQLLAKMYHAHPYDYISEKDFMAWVYANFEERKEVKNTGMAKEDMNAMFGVSKFEYKKIIFNGPCTIILWKDGTKTMAKTSSDEEVFDPEKGVAICFMKKMLGHTETNKILRKASEQYEEYIAENRPSSSLDEFIEYLSSLKSKTKSVDHIDQSAIEEVKKIEEAQIEEEDD